tara:strand:- start:6533 stop:10603 length:4071 start_codon:yes stop_codon:yes gene_type:complete
MAVRIVVDGQSFNIKGTDDPDVARKLAKRELRKRSGEFSALGETFIKGPIYGLQTGLVQGPVQLVTSIYDAARNTDYTSDVQDFFTKHKVEKPLSTAGSVSSALFQFGVPASMATKIFRRGLLKPKGDKKLFDQTGKYAKKPEFFRHTVAPIAMADFAAATSETPEFGIYKSLTPDFFAPTNPEEEIKGLDDKISAGERLGKRLRVGAEGATLLLGLPYLWRGLKQAGSGVASGLSESKGVMMAADWAKNKKNYVRNMVDEGQYNAKNFTIMGKEFDWYDVVSKFRSRGALPTEEVANVKAAKTAGVNQETTFLESTLANYYNGFTFIQKNNKMSGDELMSLAENMELALFGGFKEQQKALKMLKEVDRKYLTKKDKFKSTMQDYDLKSQQRIDRAKTFKERREAIKEATFKITEENARSFSFFKNANRLRTQADDLSEILIKEENRKFLDPAMVGAIEAKLGTYGYTAYRAFIDNIDHVVKKNSPQWKNAREELLKQNNKGVSIAKTPEEADQILKDLLTNRNFDSAYMNPSMTLEGVKMGLLTGKKLNTLPKVREFLGEITGKKGTAAERVTETIMKARATVENLSKMTSQMKYLDEVADINNRLATAGSTQRFLYNSIDEIPEARKAAFFDEYGDAIRIPDKPKFGALANKITTKRIADALTGSQLGWLEQTPGAVSKTWASFLGLKGAVQKFKTIYSPITQVRNATSASLFAAMNGNIANGKTLQDSAMIVFDMLRKTQGTDMAKYYANAQKKNVVQSGARIGEIDSLIDDAVRTLGLKDGNFLSDAYRKEKNNFATRLYVGSDDLWKIVSWEMEKGKLARAFNNAATRNSAFTISPSFYKSISPKSIRELERQKGVWSKLDDKLKNEIIEDIGADVVRNTVPNYSKVPQFIQSLRRTPFGNFIAFPAETVRTAFNSTSRAIDEIASGVPELAEVGMRRLMGNMAVMYGIPKATYEFGKYMTGADDEQVQAYKRSFAAPWEKNADLIPIRTDENGNIVEFYNYTYTNPYEYLRTPISAVFNAVQNGETRGDKLHEVMWQAFIGSEQTPGALREYLEPFIGESIATSGILDVLRNVTYASGSARPIYNSTDGYGERAGKSMAHVFNLFAPPIIPFKIKPGEVGDLGPVFLRDLPRATLASLGISEKELSASSIKPNIYGQLAESFTGLKTIKPTIERTLRFRAFDAKEQMREAVSYYTSATNNPNILNPEDHVKALMRTNEARFQAMKDLSMAVEDAKSLGADENEIYEVLKGTKISNPEMIMNRTFIPYYPSAYQIQKVLDKGGIFPEQQLRQSFVEQIKPTLPTVSFQGGPFVPPVQPKRTTTIQKAKQDPQGSAAVLLRQKELEKLLGIE